MGKWVSLPYEYYFHPINTDNIFKIHHYESVMVLPCFRQSTEISLWSTNFALLGYVKFYLILYIVNEWFLTRRQEQTSSQNNALTGFRIRQRFLELSSSTWCWQNFSKYIITCLYEIGLILTAHGQWNKDLQLVKVLRGRGLGVVNFKWDIYITGPPSQV